MTFSITILYIRNKISNKISSNSFSIFWKILWVQCWIGEFLIYKKMLSLFWHSILLLMKSRKSYKQKHYTSWILRGDWDTYSMHSVRNALFAYEGPSATFVHSLKAQWWNNEQKKFHIVFLCIVYNGRCSVIYERFWGESKSVLIDSILFEISI